MTAATITDPAVALADVDALAEYECVQCEALAVAKATCSPCGHSAGYCGPHRAAIQRTMQFRFTANQPTPCAVEGCGVIVEAVAWGRL